CDGARVRRRVHAGRGGEHRLEGNDQRDDCCTRACAAHDRTSSIHTPDHVWESYVSTPVETGPHWPTARWRYCGATCGATTVNGRVFGTPPAYERAVNLLLMMTASPGSLDQFYGQLCNDGAALVRVDHLLGVTPRECHDLALLAPPEQLQHGERQGGHAGADGRLPHRSKGGVVRSRWKRARLLCLGELRRIGGADAQLDRRRAGDAAIDAEILRRRGGLERTHRVAQAPLQRRAQTLDETGVVHDDLRRFVGQDDDARPARRTRGQRPGFRDALDPGEQPLPHLGLVGAHGWLELRAIG